MAAKKAAAKKTTVAPKTEEETKVGATESTTETKPAEQPETKAAATPKVKVTSGPISVILKNGQSRVYSFETHGEHYRTLANQFAEHNNGTVL